jgi:aspartate aminotransferase
MKLSQRASSVKPSATLKITALAESLKREGKDVIVLAAGQPDFHTPEYIKTAGKEAIDKNITFYTPVAGMIEFKKAIQQKFLRDNNLHYNLDEIVAGTGAKQIIYNAIFALVDPGDEVIIPSPYWVSYPEIVQLAGGIPIYLNTTIEEKFLINPDKLKKTITNKTKVIILNSPSNPTGAVYPKELLYTVGQLCADRGITIVSDEIYEYLVYDNLTAYSLASLDPALKAITITVNGLSKAFSMTGWRIGFGAGPKDVIKAMTDLQGHCTSNASSIGQYAGITALSRNREQLKEYFDLFEERRNIAYERVSKMPDIETIKPQGAFYIFPNVSAYYGKQYKHHTITDSASFCQYMLEELLISPVPGGEFGDDNYIRISYSINTDLLKKALERFEEGLKKLS